MSTVEANTFILSPLPRPTSGQAGYAAPGGGVGLFYFFLRSRARTIFGLPHHSQRIQIILPLALDILGPF